MVPLWLTVGGEQFRDGELDLAEVVSRLGDGLSTSGPAPGELASAAEAADSGDGVVLLTLSKRMSGVYEAGRVAADLLAAGPSTGPSAADALAAGPLAAGPLAAGARRGRQVAVLDTGTAAGAQALVVLAAARAARAGLPLAGVVAAAERASAAARLVATLPTLDHLARGGRVPGAAAWAARWLGLNPLFEFRAGQVKALRPARGRPQAHARLVEIWARGAGEGGRRGARLHVAAMHALAPEAAEYLLAEVGRRVTPVTAFSCTFSPVMVAHTGPGLVGLAWWWEEPAPPGGR